MEGGDASPLADLPYVEVVADKTQADLVWSADGTVEHVVGGVVAEKVDAAGIKGVASKWAALKWLKHQASLAPVPATLASGNQRYKVGDVVQIGISEREIPASHHVQSAAGRPCRILHSRSGQA